MTRFAQCRTSSPHALEIAGLFSVPADEVKDIEAAMHNVFSNFRHKGEWFEVDGGAATAVTRRILDWMFSADTAPEYPTFDYIDLTSNVSSPTHQSMSEE